MCSLFFERFVLFFCLKIERFVPDSAEIWICGLYFSDIGYHFYVTRNGKIHCGRPLEKIGAHCKNHNRHSIGICYEGGLDIRGTPADTRTLLQKASLTALLRELKRIFPKILVVGHHDLNPMKACPCFNAVAEYEGVS